MSPCRPATIFISYSRLSNKEAVAGASDSGGDIVYQKALTAACVVRAFQFGVAYRQAASYSTFLLCFVRISATASASLGPSRTISIMLI